MYDFHNSVGPINSIVYSTDDNELSKIRGTWECTIQCTTDDETTLAISKTKYFVVLTFSQVKYVYGIREWIFYPQSPGKVTARFSRRASVARTRMSPASTCTPTVSESELEKYFTESPDGVIDAPELGTISVDLEGGADAIAVYYGLQRSQISITVRDLKQN